MNLRLPIAAAVVAVAAGAAAFRAAHRDPSPPFATAASVGVLDPSPSEPLRPVVRISPTPEAVPRVTVYVAGDVARPGVYALRGGSRVVDALRAAGGPAADADPIAVNLAEPLVDGREIAVPVRGSASAAEADATIETETDAAGASDAHRHRAKKRRHKHRKHRSHRHAATTATGDDGSGPADAASDTAAPATTVDLNTADENELETLPGIGASLASRIVAFRAINGAFASTDDLLDVNGMTQSRLDGIALYVTTR